MDYSLANYVYVLQGLYYVYVLQVSYHKWIAQMDFNRSGDCKYFTSFGLVLSLFQFLSVLWEKEATAAQDWYGLQTTHYPKKHPNGRAECTVGVMSIQPPADSQKDVVCCISRSLIIKSVMHRNSNLYRDENAKLGAHKGISIFY